MKFPLSKGEIAKDFIRALLDVAAEQIEESIKNTHPTSSPTFIAKTANNQVRTNSSTTAVSYTHLTLPTIYSV